MQSNIEKTYRKVQPIEHVLLRPDTYIGAICSNDQFLWILQDDQVIFKKIKYIPGMFKIFDQILVNAADNYQRDKKMTKIEVNISKDEVSILNDGKSIPVQIHKTHKIYVPQLIFGHLLTSSNYEDQDKKVVGGRNGYGAKLTNIFSTKFNIEIADSTNKKLFKMEWLNNMKQHSEPHIQTYQGKDYTKITFRPDFKRFGIKEFSSELINLMKRRTYDIGGIIKSNVFLDGKMIQVHNFKQYVGLYLSNEELAEINVRNSRWQVYASRSQGQFMQISFVNGINTIKGGTHVNYILEQIIQKIIASISKKKNSIAIKPFQVKAHLKLFINCLIQNPSFDSQSKENLTTPSAKFGSACTITDDFVKDLLDMGIGEHVLSEVKLKQHSKIDKQLKKLKKNRLIIPKLEDANEAGKRKDCCLILTEGDSAKSLALCGIEQLGRDLYGVYPLKGKLVNVKELTPKMVMQNVELSNIVKILGLSFGKVYTNTDDLRYGSVMIMADQDNDGSHIKGLAINFFQTFWPSLCKIHGFLQEFITPIIKCSKSSTSLSFYSQADYRKWQLTAESGWIVKYYKGLGTSTARQAKEYFTALQKHQLFFRYDDQEDRKSLDLAFGKKNADLRKQWLLQYNPETCIDHSIKTVKVADFINKQLIHFSISDNVRSIPSVLDGLKPSQRKVLFACFKRNLVNEIKVAQLAGYVAQHSAYHHGEASLCATIVGMAQNYVGSNNLNMLQPLGQFGTRHLNGKDAASARYIFTKLNTLTRYLFNQADDHIVQYIEEQNQKIQPKYYLPILPLVLINGSEGIGTGWSTTIYPHKVSDVISLVRAKLKGNALDINIGWENFQGSVEKDDKGTYVVKGIYQRNSQQVIIREIPVTKSIRDYKSFLQQLIQSIENQDPHLEDMKQYHHGNNIQFLLNFIAQKLPTDQNLQKFLKLSANFQQNNMHLFDKDLKIKKYDNIHSILNDFYQERMRGYEKRKKYLISKFQKESKIINNQKRFIQEVIQGRFRQVQGKQQWVGRLKESKYLTFQDLNRILSTKAKEDDQNDRNKDYNYLLNMPIWSFCQQKIDEMNKTSHQLQLILQYYQNISEKELWLIDIDNFQKAWQQVQLGNEIKRHQDSNKRNQVPQTKTKSRPKRSREEVSSDQQKKTVAKSKNSRNRKNIMEEQIQKERVEDKKIGRKRVKIEEQIKQDIKPCLNKTQLKPQPTSDIDSLLTKYLCKSNGSQSQPQSLEQRVRARIKSGDPSFNLSYCQARDVINKQVDKIHSVIQNLDWIQQ